MVYQCIACKEFWCDDDREEDEIINELKGEDYFSHGLCPHCAKEQLTPLYRRRQRKEGNFECFGTASGFCDRDDCCFKEMCLNNENPRYLDKVKILTGVGLNDPLF